MRLPDPRIIVVALLVLAAAVYVIYAIEATPGSVYLPNPPTRFTVNGRSFVITYIATDERAREAGLMNRRVTNTTTMLFAFPTPGQHGFWMKDVNSSLDIIWLDVNGSTGRVVYVVPSVPPCVSPINDCPVYENTTPSNWMIEAKGGFSEENGIEVGSVILFG